MEQISACSPCTEYVALCDPLPCGGPFGAAPVRYARAGATVAVKWRVLDAEGVPVADPAHFAGVTSAAPLEQEDLARGSGPRYLGDGYWRFLWEIPARYAGQSRTMTLWLQGTTRSALLQFS
jgi:hypothetical protein